MQQAAEASAKKAKHVSGLKFDLPFSNELILCMSAATLSLSNQTLCWSTAALSISGVFPDEYSWRCGGVASFCFENGSNRYYTNAAKTNLNNRWCEVR